MAWRPGRSMAPVGVVGFGVIGARMLTGTDANWEQTAEPARTAADETVPLPA